MSKIGNISMKRVAVSKPYLMSNGAMAMPVDDNKLYFCLGQCFKRNIEEAKSYLLDPSNRVTQIPGYKLKEIDSLHDKKNQLHILYGVFEKED